ncbi:hypothetical protein [Mangrovibrevibacter kandeliae]|uniref:hypothetical protein n=1 Tax=Mangrovibrevibacter kandeliae TaxID=2968473 RepID=UPI002117A818|nr:MULTISPECIES: hypothetical protein [unclassified Aurantimonas]MCQ8783878.1 hypothetical protein [Aurantimonas sp. CSK15Z-1]MCW4116597.1 hypothetical protein [Aurantimonas sp. MSK8Z-1]
MPTLVRLLTTIAIIAGVILAIMAALVTFVEPHRRQVDIEIPVRELPQEAATGVAQGSAPAGDAAVAQTAAGADDPAAPTSQPSALELRP